MLGDPDDPFPDIPFDAPLTDDEAARVLGFRAADDEFRAWRKAVDDPRRRGPPPSPPTWRTRIPGWDIHQPGGGVRLTADGQGWRETATGVGNAGPTTPGGHS